MAVGHFSKNNPGALGELQHNQQESAPRSPRKQQNGTSGEERSRSQSPRKATWNSSPLKAAVPRETSKEHRNREPSPTKPQKQKSGTNLVGLLSRPKSLKNLYKQATEDDVRASKDKENRTPVGTPRSEAPTPIYAQFTNDPVASQQGSQQTNENGKDSKKSSFEDRPAVKGRPQSFQVVPTTRRDQSMPSSLHGSKTAGNVANTEHSGSNSSPTKSHRSRVFGALPGFGHARSKSATTCPTGQLSEPLLDHKDIDRHLEAMLDRRNIPENQRYKMRNLSDTIKMEFIRQDWAEMKAAKSETSQARDSAGSAEASSAIAAGSDGDEEKPRRTRGKSFTFSRGKKDSSSPAKKNKGEGTLGRHFRTKSTESIASERPSSAAGSPPSTSLFSKIKNQNGPAEYVAYLRKVQKPELVEVGKLHKLRLLLRNETVAWIEDFIQQGGMKEIVGLLQRIMDVEWREEHEDALLHENLLCLKALSTTARGMQYLDSIQATLFPKLLHMLFDPERKGPSEFTTRNIITSVLFTYIESAAPQQRTYRAQNILKHMRDPEPKEDERPLPFVLEMRQERPYRVWCKEVVSVTKEVFWIFLHNLNVVSLAAEKSGDKPTQAHDDVNDPSGYMLRNFPQERAPVAAAPYVGGVEWDATNYLASHLDLINAILACTPLSQDRNALRAQFRISGWERCMGGSLRLCKEKFYGSVHEGLRTWVAAASEDGWSVADVRYGPPADSYGSPKKSGGGQKKKVEEAPKLDMPWFELDMGNNGDGNKKQTADPDDAWL